MQKSPHDIYGTRHNEPTRNALRDKPFDAKDLPWKELWDRHRRQSILFGAVTFLCAMLLILVIVQQYRLTISPRFEPTMEPREIPATPPQSPSPYLDFTMDRHTAFLMDELLVPPLTSGENPNAQDMPLEGPWVKKVAYHLIQADLNEREGLGNKAREHYENALRIFPDLRGVHKQLGVLYLRQKQHEKAAASFEKAALEEVMDHGIANNLGVAYMNLDREPEAEDQFLRAIRLDSTYAPAYYNLAQLYMRQNDMERAAAAFHHYMELEPTQIEAALTYAYVLIQVQEWQAAAALLKQISDIAPESPPIYFRLAQALSHTGEQREAITMLYRAVSLVDARNALAWMTRPEFDALRDHPEFQRLISDLGGNR